MFWAGGELPQYAGRKTPAATRPQRQRERPPASHTGLNAGLLCHRPWESTVRRGRGSYTFGGFGWWVGGG